MAVLRNYRNFIKIITTIYMHIMSIYNSTLLGTGKFGCLIRKACLFTLMETGDRIKLRFTVIF